MWRNSIEPLQEFVVIPQADSHPEVGDSVKPVEAQAGGGHVADQRSKTAAEAYPKERERADGEKEKGSELQVGPYPHGGLL